MFYLKRRNCDLLGRDLFKSFFDDFPWSKHQLMKTDIREDDNNYYLDVEMPGVSKENIKLSVEDGNLLIAIEENDEVNEEKDNYLRKERYYGAYSRSFYIGNVKQEDISASSVDGILKITIPKEKPIIEEKKFINID